MYSSRQHKIFTVIYLMMYKRALPMIWTSSGEEHNMSAKNNDNHNRFRSQTIAFRVSPEEDKQINIAVSLSGMTKQDYITYKLLDRTINVKASCKVHRAVYDQLTIISNRATKSQ